VAGNADEEEKEGVEVEGEKDEKEKEDEEKPKDNGNANTRSKGKGDDEEDYGGEDEEAGDDDEDEDNNNDDSDDEEKHKLTRTNVRKVAKFMSDLKSMMESVLDDVAENSLPANEKATCQQLLLQISINEKMFNEEQRHYAKAMLKKLEGNRRRRCRTSDQSSRFTQSKSRRGEEEPVGDVIPEELRIVSTKKTTKEAAHES